ncbi:hypothetical protein HYS79_00690 [Patescibacteria group bacterium]|nr:hypothetical protein [Patescibacteria group bacterium]
MKRLPKIIALFLAGVALAAGAAVHAQTLGSQPDPIQFVIAPELPGPGEQVVIQVQGVGTFLGNATITWQKNGATALSGVGERVFSFTAGGLGVSTRVHVVVNSPTNGTFVRDFVFIPSAINLLWEADTSVPPRYAGKALYSAGSQVSVTAFPTVVANGTTISSNNLSFQWQQNGEPVPQSSGKGRDTFTFVGSQLRSAEAVGVDVYLSEVKVGHAEIVIPSEDPQLVLYARDPLRGVLYGQAVPSGIALGSKELTLQAVPYFFSTDSVASGAATYAWTLNGTPTSGPDSARGLLTLRQTGSGVGSAILGVTLQNNDPSKFVQSASTALRIVFGEQTGNTLSSFFGL